MSAGRRSSAPLLGVSILVVVDRTHGQALAELKATMADVSILVVVDRTHGPPRPEPAPSVIPPVSILVVVDRTHGQLDAPGQGLSTRKFQSLLLWIGLTDILVLSELVDDVRVSILVVVDRTHGPYRWGQGGGLPLRFNPCCCGSDSRTTIGVPPAWLTSMFQSLLLWIGLTDSHIYSYRIERG